MLWDELSQNSPGLWDSETQAGVAAARLELSCTVIHQNRGFNRTKRSCKFRFQSFGCMGKCQHSPAGCFQGKIHNFRSAGVFH